MWLFWGSVIAWFGCLVLSEIAGGIFFLLIQYSNPFMFGLDVLACILLGSLLTNFIFKPAEMAEEEAGRKVDDYERIRTHVQTAIADLRQPAELKTPLK
jgi:hypothetical protein